MSRGGRAQEVAVARPVVRVARGGGLQAVQIVGARSELQQAAIRGVAGCFGEQDQGQGVVVRVRAMGVALPVQDVDHVPLQRVGQPDSQ
ncbi:hypothetical protein [Streptomyces sp. NPDC058335]|uniref:hypothetical protein n=1 Tax=Streptomyces sp. NPDC058335 TaxID=3346451 RepID=UPI0036659F14